MRVTDSMTEDPEVAQAFARVAATPSPQGAWQRQANIARILGEAMPPQRVGRFEVLGYIGRGAMGEVLAARDAKLDRKVAIKLLAGRPSPGALERFEREGRALARLSHPNIVTVHEVGEHDGVMFIAMEHVEGQTLSQWLQADHRSWREILEVFIAAGRGLSAAHQAGLVHRDFKPDNVMVGTDGRVRVLDFGLAREVETGSSIESAPADSGTGDEETTGRGRVSSRVTQTGALVGTPAYMAPEQHRLREATAASDQFAFCVALYEALGGVRPFAKHVRSEILAAIEARDFATPDHAMPRGLSAILTRGLALEPHDRWPSMDALLVRLSRRLAPRHRLVASLALAGAVGLLGVGLWRFAEVGQRCKGGEDRIAEVWGSARADAIRTAVLDTHASFASETWARVHPMLDDWGSAWANQHREICEATRVRQEQSAEVMDVAMACLDRQRVEFRVTLDVLADPDATVVEQAIPLVSRLPSPAECADFTRASATPDRPADPALARRADAVAEGLARVRALLKAGRHLQAEPEAEAMLAEAEAIGHLSLLADAVLARGQVAQKLARHEAAAEDVERAYLLATEHRNGGVEARAAILQIWIVGVHQAKKDEGLRWADTALALARRDGADPVLEAHALEGKALMQQGQPGGAVLALAGLERAKRIAESVTGATSLEVARILKRMADAQFKLDQFDAAVQLAEQSIAMTEEIAGPDHPLVGSALLDAANALTSMRKLDEAIALRERALGIFERAGYPSPNLAGALLGLGLATSWKGDLEGAISYLERSVEVFAQTSGPEHPDVGKPLTALGDVYKNLKRWDDAVRVQRRAVEIRMKAHGPQAASVNQVGLAGALIELDRVDEAREVLKEALPALKDGPYPWVFAIAHAQASEAARRAGAIDEAIEHARAAIEITAYPGIPPSGKGYATWKLMLALYEVPEQRSRAHELAAELIESYREGGTPEDVAEVEAWVAEHPR